MRKKDRTRQMKKTNQDAVAEKYIHNNEGVQHRGKKASFEELSEFALHRV